MRSVVFQRFLAVYLLELRLTCTHWSYLIFMAIWSVFIFLTYTQNDFASLYGLSNIVLGFGSLIAMFLTGLQASRAQRSRVDMLEVALPTGVEMFLARWVASLTAVAGLMVAPLIVMLIAPAGRATLMDIVRMIGLTMLSSAFVTGLIWLVQNTVGIRRWMYPFFPVLWVGAGMIPGAIRIKDNLQIPGTNLLNFITMDQNTYSMWGSLPNGQLPSLFLIFYVGLVLLFAGVMLWRTISARFYRRSPLVMALTGAAIALVLFIGATYTAEVHARNQQIIADNEYAEANFMSVQLPVDMPFRVTAYDVTFANESPARFTANINVTNRSDEPINALMFSLYHQFEVTDASLPFTRDHNTLTLTLSQPLEAGESTSISVTYQGVMWYMGGRYGSPPQLDYFTNANGVNLGCQVLWYPVPGRVLPSYISLDENLRAWHNCVLDTPATFRLTINDSNNIAYTSNLTQVDATTFDSAGTTWVQLLGIAGLQTRTEGPLTVVALESEMPTAFPQVQQYYLPAMQHVQRFLPEMQHLQVTVLDLEDQSMGYWASRPATAESVIVVNELRVLGFFALNQQNEFDYVGSRMVTSLFDGQYTLYTDGIAYFLWLHYVADGDVEEIGTILSVGLPTGSTGSFRYGGPSYEERYMIAFALYDVYVAQGETAVRDILRQMYEQRDTLGILPIDEVAEWIRAQ